MTEIRDLQIINHGTIHHGSLFFENGKIVEGRSESSNQIIDGKGLFASAGFIDMHIHGAMGHDFMDGDLEGFEMICEEHLRHGVTTIIPTSSTGSFKAIRRMIDNQKVSSKRRSQRQSIPGIHIEGQYISMARSGGMDTRYIHAPVEDEYKSLFNYADGSILRWSVAPELAGAMTFGRWGHDHGAMMSIAHSDATYDQVKEALDNGYSHLTHFYSDMNSITRHNGFRVMGAIEAGYDLPIDVEIISDGCHIPPQLFNFILRHIDYSRINLVSDCIKCAGMETRNEEGQEIVDVGENGRCLKGLLEDGVVKFLDRSAFHGSIAMGNMLLKASHQKGGQDFAKCVAMMTETPARMLSLSDKGSLDVGKDADVVLLDKDLNIASIFFKGNKIN